MELIVSDWSCDLQISSTRPRPIHYSWKKVQAN